MIDREFEKEKARKRRNRNSNKMKKSLGVCKNNFYDLSYEEIKDLASRNMNNLKKCSCFMCGNVRKHQGRTIQEKRFYQDDEI